MNHSLMSRDEDTLVSVRLDDDLRAITAARELEGDAALPSFAP